MVFSSISFLFIFLPLTLAVYFLVPARCRRGRNLVLLIFSLLFYFYGEPVGILLMLLSILWNYGFALALSRAARPRLWLIPAVLGNLLLLGTFKYADFLVQNLNRLPGIDLPLPGILMPIGISFYTFQGMSYLFDVYRRRVPAQRNLLHVATYIAMFPQLVAGPIVRYESVAAELEDRRETLPRAALGVRRFTCGLAKKMLLGNPMGEIAKALFAADPAALSAPLAWIGAAAWALHIYFDFSGYSDMAIGLGHILGFTFPENFRYPYTARSVTDFWRRWHMSLSSWFRDYVYIPLGGSRRGLPRQLLNILIVWALTGLWHGAAWNFVAWGLWFALLLTLEKLFLLRVLDRLPRVFGHLYTLLAVLLGWVLFASPTLPHAAGYFAALLRPGDAAALGRSLYWLRQYLPQWLGCVLCALPLAPALSRRFSGRAWYEPLTLALTWGLLLLSLLSVVSSSFNPFIYFRF